MSIFNLINFSAAFQWVIHFGYPLMFLAMLIEGPIVTAAASFAIVFGYFNFGIIFILAFLGDIVADIIYYAIGYFSRVALIEKFGYRFGLTQKRMERLESLINKNPIKTLIALKLTPIIPTPGLMIVGTTKMPLKKFIILSSIVVIPKTILFMLVGYYFGQAYDTIIKTVKSGGLVLVFILIAIVIIYYGFTKISAYLARKVEKI